MLLFFLLFQLYTNIVLCALIYTCPLELWMNDRLTELRENVLCNKTIDCKRLRGMFTSSYRKNLIILRPDTNSWLDTSNVVDRLSKCNIRSTVITMTENNITNLDRLCSRDKITTVLTWSDKRLTFVEDVNTKNSSCVLNQIDLNESQDIVGTIVSSCTHTAWIIGKSGCNSTTNQGTTARVHLVSEDNDFFSAHSRKFKIVTVAYQVFLHNDTVDGTPAYSGPIFELIDRFANKLNLSYEICHPIDYKYGIQDSNGSWNGMIGMLQRKEVDMAAAAMTITESRSKAVDFTAPFYNEPYGILIHKPDPANKLWNAFSVFSRTVWIGIIATAIVSTLVTYLIHKFAAKPASTGFEQIGGCVWYVTAGLVNQGGEIEPEAWSGRNFLAFWWLYVVAIIAVYSGLLVAQLAIGKTVLPFKNLHELALAAKEGHYKFCIPDSTVIHEAVKKGTTGDYQLLRDVVASHPEFVRSEKECLNVTRDEKDVALIDELTQLLNVQKINCKQNIPMIILSDEFLAGYFGFALQKGSPLRDIISFEIREAFDAGLILMWKMLTEVKHGKNTSFCELATPDDVVAADNSQMGLDDFAGSFAILAIGILVSLIMFCLEQFQYLPLHLFHCAPNRKKEKRQ